MEEGWSISPVTMLACCDAVLAQLNVQVSHEDSVATLAHMDGGGASDGDANEGNAEQPAADFKRLAEVLQTRHKHRRDHANPITATQKGENAISKHRDLDNFLRKSWPCFTGPLAILPVF